ncbi:MAG: class GN sortase [Rhizobiales bacterium]|nr:class GN sortase [Hyphomicrobiales bacterium]
MSVLARRVSLSFGLIAIILGLTLAGNGVWIKAKAVVAQVLLERAFAETVKTGVPIKAWRWADTRPVARIRSERLGDSAIVLAGGSGEAMAFGPGHLSGTPRPGQPGTAVIAAHRDTHFRFLKHLRRGDELSIERDDGMRFRFQVSGYNIVRWDTPGIDVTADGHNLVLATCWPFEAKTSGPLRYVVHAQMIE